LLACRRPGRRFGFPCFSRMGWHRIDHDPSHLGIMRVRSRKRMNIVIAHPSEAQLNSIGMKPALPGARPHAVSAGPPGSAGSSLRILYEMNAEHAQARAPSGKPHPESAGPGAAAPGGA
jgi:hypothetical protein